MVEGKKGVCVCDVSEQVGITTQAGLKNSKTFIILSPHKRFQNNKQRRAGNKY